MYNSQTKNKYLEYLKPNTNAQDLAEIIRIFQQIQDIEEKYQKDVAYFSLHELEELYCVFGYTKMYAFRNLQKKVNAYIKWYKNNYDNTVECIAMSVETIEQILLQGKDENAFHITDKLFKKLIDSLIDSYEIQTAYVLTAVYSGLKGDKYSEVILLKKEDIDFNSRQIKIYAFNRKTKELAYNRTMAASDTFLNVIRLAISEEIFRNKNGKLLGYFNPSSYALKSRTTSQVEKDIELYVNSQYKRITDIVKRMKKDSSYALTDLTLENIRRSGISNALIAMLGVLDEPISRVNEDRNKFIKKAIKEKYNITDKYLESVIASHVLK